ncbi:tetratricopeptide repeat protein [Methylobacterium sp. JK268]
MFQTWRNFFRRSQIQHVVATKIESVSSKVKFESDARICICLSGQLRSPAIALENLRAACSNHSVTVILSTWSKIGRRIDGTVSASQAYRMFEPDAASAISWSWFGTSLSSFLPALYDETKHKLEGHDADVQADEDRIETIVRSYFPDAIIDIEDSDVLDLSFEAERVDPNSMRMFYKAWRVNEIKRRLERKRGRQFDYVIRMRPDFLLNTIDEAFISSSCTEKCILVDGKIEGQLWADDSLAIGKSEAIDKYCRVFGKLVIDRENWDFIHRELGSHLQSMGIDFVRYPYHGYIAPDIKFSCDDVIRALRHQQNTGTTWSLNHIISLRSLEIFEAISRGDLAAADGKLEELLTDQELKSAPKDGLFFVLGELSRAKNHHRKAFALFALAITARDRDAVAEQWYPIQRAATVAARLPDIITADRSAAIVEDISHYSFSDVFSHRVADIIKELFGSMHPRVEATLPKIISSNHFIERYTRELDHADRSEEALVILGDAVRSGKITDLGTRYRLADRYKASGKYVEAYQTQKAAMVLDVPHAGANRQLAEICASLGEWEEAHRAAVTAFTLIPSVVHAIVLAATALRNDDSANFARAMEMVPPDAENEAATLAIPGVSSMLKDARAKWQAGS